MNMKKETIAFLIIFLVVFLAFKKKPNVDYPVFHYHVEAPKQKKVIVENATYQQNEKPKFVFVKNLFAPPPPQNMPSGLPSLQQLLFGTNAPANTGPRLVGIVKKGNEKIALIMMPNNQLKALKQGQFLKDHVRVASISDYKVVLSYKQKGKVYKQTLSIYNTGEKKYEKK